MQLERLDRNLFICIAGVLAGTNLFLCAIAFLQSRHLPTIETIVLVSAIVVGVFPPVMDVWFEKRQSEFRSLPWYLWLCQSGPLISLALTLLFVLLLCHRTSYD